VSFYFTPPMFSLVYRRRPAKAEPAEVAPTEVPMPLRLAAE